MLIAAVMGGEHIANRGRRAIVQVRSRSPHFHQRGAGRIGGAVVRSRARRLLRESFRVHQHDLAVPVDPTTGTYGGIDRVSWTFWRSKYTSAALSATTIQGAMNTMWASLTRGVDRPDLIIADNIMWGYYVASLQAQQRFVDPKKASLGFPSLKFFDSADVVLDGGIGGYATARTEYFLNTEYLFFRPHKNRNCVPLSPNKRYAINQDAEVALIGWAGNLTCSGAQFQGRLVSST